jgi:hypothetical protein
MTNNEIKNPEDMKDFNPSEDLNLFFNNFIKAGTVTKEEDIVPGLRLKVKVLNTGELLTAESVLQLSNPNIPFDVVEKVRAASILSQAILEINGVPVEKDDMKPEQNSQRRSALYSQLLKMPALVVQKSYELYVTAVREQNKLYTTDGEIEKKAENF